MLGARDTVMGKGDKNLCQNKSIYSNIQPVLWWPQYIYDILWISCRKRRETKTEPGGIPTFL